MLLYLKNFYHTLVSCFIILKTKDLDSAIEKSERYYVDNIKLNQKINKKAKKIIFNNDSYVEVGKDYHPEEGEVLYKFDDCIEDEYPLGIKITKWGSKHHGEEDHYLIEGENIYPLQKIEEWREEYGKKKLNKMLGKNSKTSWYYLPELYKKL